jgi:hypothetical protein
MQNIKLFPDQPSLDEKDLFDLEKRGFIIPEKFLNPHTGQLVSNRFPGDICSFTMFREVLKNQRQFTKEDAQRLVVIEANRKGGRPRRSHLLRLFQTIEYCQRAEIENKIKEHRKLWAVNHP